MQITTEAIRALNPCDNRFNNFLQHYPDFNGTTKDFVMLENITYADKIWVLTRVMTHEQKVEFAIKCASSVLDLFEQKYPDDLRPKKALEAVEAWLANPTKENANAAYAAAAAAADARAAAYARAADAAADAAAYAAYAVRAVTAAAYATDADAADAAAYAAAYAAYAAYTDAEQLELNLIFAVEILEAKK